MATVFILADVSRVLAPRAQRLIGLGARAAHINPSRFAGGELCSRAVQRGIGDADVGHAHLAVARRRRVCSPQHQTESVVAVRRLQVGLLRGPCHGGEWQRVSGRWDDGGTCVCSED